MSPPATTLADQQRAFDAFRRVYNEERPHKTLGQRPPASRYDPVAAPLPRQSLKPRIRRWRRKSAGLAATGRPIGRGSACS